MHERPLPPLLVFAASALLLVAAAIVAIVGLREAGTLLVLHFDTFRSIDFLGTRADVFAIVGVGAGLVALNAFLAAAYRKRLPIGAHLFAYASVLIGILILIAVGTILAVN